MFGGGHFAGMVVSLIPKFVGKGKGKEKVREVVVLEKKTFHRYTSMYFLSFLLLCLRTDSYDFGT